MSNSKSNLLPGWNRDPAKRYFRLYQKPSADDIAVFQGLQCAVCWPITRDLGVFSVHPEALKPDQGAIIEWPIKLSDLAETAEAGCQLCRFMAVKFFFRIGTIVFSKLEMKNEIACCSSPHAVENASNIEAAVKQLRDFCGRFPDVEFGMVVEPLDWVREDLKFERIKISASTLKNLKDEKAVTEIMNHNSAIVLEIYATEGDPAAHFIKGRPITTDPASERSVNQVKTWINECFQKHSGCPDPAQTYLPTRVIKIFDAENVALYSASQKEAAEYTTLSYCWGGPQVLSNTLATKDRLSRGFKISELPQTLQDAIAVTAKLGLQYVWIDSLCIIQDSVDDKVLELPKMSSYYKNSHVTICAGGEKVTDGFMKTQHECEQHPGTGLPKNLMKIPFLCPTDENGSVGTIYFCEERQQLLSWEPVSRRAWTLQEQLLSPRLLIYGSRLVWQCHTHQHADGGAEDWSEDKNAANHRRIQLVLGKSAMSIENPISKDGMEKSDLHSGAENKITNGDEEKVTKGASDRDISPLLDIWYHTIRIYSRRKITFPEDKLSAIAGLASEFSTLSGDQYLAGLWRAQILRDLMWSTWPELHLIKPKIWRAPSWSWVSIKNDITFDQLPGKDATPLAEIVDVKCTLLHEALQFGEVKDGLLEINGPLIHLDRETVTEFMRDEYGMPPPSGMGLDWLKMAMNLLPQDGYEESDEKWEAPEGVCLLGLWADFVAAGEEAQREWNAEAEKAAKEKGGAWDEKNLDEEDKLYVAHMRGLVLGKREDGSYERAASFTNFRLTSTKRWLRESWEFVQIV